MNEHKLYCQECGKLLQTIIAIGSEFRKCPNYEPSSNHTYTYIRDIPPKYDVETGKKL